MIWRHLHHHRLLLARERKRTEKTLILYQKSTIYFDWTRKKTAARQQGIVELE